MKTFQIPTKKLLRQYIKADMRNEGFQAGLCPIDGILFFHIYLLYLDDIIITHSYYIHTDDHQIQISSPICKGIPPVMRSRRESKSQGKWIETLGQNNWREKMNVLNVGLALPFSFISLIFCLLWPRSKWIQL